MVIDSASDGKANSYEALTIAVSDTGIGIPDDKHGIIFEAFKQSDGSTSRKYGGTGLGLSISKELIALLGGSIKLHSVRGEGSTFTLILPMNREFQNSQDQVAVTVEDIHDKKDNRSESKISYEQESKELEVKNDDRELMNSGTKDKLLLIIEDDPNFSQILYDLAHEKGYQGIIAEDGQTGLEMVKRYQPDAVLLDINLPDMNGWTIIDHLKKDSNTDKIPVHIISGSEVNNPSDLLDGIVGYLKKPVSLESMDAAFGKIESALSKKVKKLLIVDENEQQIKEITKLVSDKNIQIIALNKGSDAISMLKNERVDCMILELKLKDMSGFELLKKLKEENIYGLPVIIHTDKVLTQDDDIELRRFAESIIIKGSRSVERLLAETTLFLHDLDSKIEESKIKAIKSEREKESSFQNKKILIVDDDMRNVFALTSLLEEKGMKVVVGRNGKEGIQRLNQNSDINLILMDIMMPEMDGYLAMEEIRKIEKYRKIPMIALTAKAMKDDRQKCIEAGASDYLTKPLDIDKLTSLLRVWLYK
jgi:CheY-like chemotaxis protein